MDEQKRCASCVHWNGTQANAEGDCPFYIDKTPAEHVCDRWFSMDQLRKGAYGRPRQERLL